MEDSGLASVVRHSGAWLEVLEVNGCRGLSREGLEVLGECTKLEKVDLGFVRAVDDGVVEGLVGRGVWSGIWGCKGVTECAGRGGGGRGGVVGREADVVA